VFVPNQTDGVILTYYEGTWEDQPDALTIGPAWFQSFLQWSDTQYIYNLNFGDGYKGQPGLEQTVLEARYAFAALGNSLYGFEIGNEVDGKTSVLTSFGHWWQVLDGWSQIRYVSLGLPNDRRPANWTQVDYVREWLQYAQAISNDSIGLAEDKEVEPLFQGCAYEAPRNLTVDPNVWNVADAIRDGMARTGKLKTVSDHDVSEQRHPSFLYLWLRS
jgi:hypothetical protein